jgi:hypothetical protein
MKRTIVFSAIVFAFATATAFAETREVPTECRPTCRIEKGVAVLAFPKSQIPERVEVYGGKGVRRIVPGKDGIVRVKNAKNRWFNFVLHDRYAHVVDGSSYSYSKGVRTEPSRRYGGRAENGAALAPVYK